LEKCNGKQPYYTQAEAEAALESIVRRAKKTGRGGNSYRRLNVYPCGLHFHVGRNNTLKIKPLPAEKTPSTGELRRRLKRIDEKLVKDLRHRLYVAGQKIEADALAEKAKQQSEYESALAAIGIKEN
jgi:hypothetical protein